jgi:hypothetical protein
MFDKSNYFVNTARVRPDALVVDGQNHLNIAGTNTNAVCIMLGVVTECMLVDEELVLSQTYHACKVTIVPFAQEMHSSGVRCSSLILSQLLFQLVVCLSSPRSKARSTALVS